MSESWKDRNYNRLTLYILVAVIIVLLLVITIRMLFLVPRVGCDANDFKYLNGDLVCGKPDVIKKSGFTPLRTKIDNLIDSMEKKGIVTEASLYLRDLVHGPTTGIHEAATFAPASLMKLPIAIVYFSLEEETPGILDQTLTITNVDGLKGQRIAPPIAVQVGTTYTVEELIRRMLTYSDNAAYEALYDYAAQIPDGQSRVLRAYQELGVTDLTSPTQQLIAVRGYATLFTLLYNFSSLEKENSEKILSWLSQATYKKGLVAGVPEGVTVAHKFGERITDIGEKQLHDCGIVYFPENPYLLCVMARGDDWGGLESTIQVISKMVYDEMDSRRY